MCYLVSATNEINPIFSDLPPLRVRESVQERAVLVIGKSRTKKWGLIDKIMFYIFG